MGMILKYVIFLLTVFLAVPSFAPADMRQFVPRLYGVEGELQVGALYDSLKNTSAAQGLNTTDIFFTERIELTTAGFIFLPQFIQFLADVNFGLNHEMFKSDIAVPSAGNGSWTTALAEEYDLWAVVLPEHPNTLELTASRHNPYIRGTTTPGFQGVTTEEGVTFKYKKRPFLVLLSYALSDIESQSVTSDSSTLRANASYSPRWASFSGSYSHTISENLIGGLQTANSTEDDFTFSNHLPLLKGRIRLSTDINEENLKQVNPASSTSLNDKRLAASELANIILPYNFAADLTYRYMKDDLGSNTSAGPSASLGSTTNLMGATITHKLYESLLTAYSFNYSTNTSLTGDLMTVSHFFSSTYTNNIPKGQLIATVNLGLSTVEEKGAPTTVNEVHSAALFGQFKIQNANIDPSSIGITVRSAVGNVVIDLLQDINYTVVLVGNTVQIQIIAIPAEALRPDPLFVYEFNVSYSLISAVFGLKSTSVGYSLRLEFFERLLNIYSSHTGATQTITSGSIPGGPEQSSDDLYGISSERPWYSLVVEYENYRSNLNPSKTFRALANIQRDITETAKLSAGANYTLASYGQVEGAADITNRERSFSGNVRFDKRFLHRNITLSLAGTYEQQSGIFISATYSLNSSVIWTRPKIFDLKMGADISRKETQSTFGNEKANYTYFYINIRRKLF